jgi:ATP-dependent Lon protease
MGCSCRQTRPAAFIVATSLAGALGSLECVSQAQQGWRRGYNYIVEADELEKTSRLSRYDGEDREREAWRGVVWGLVVTGMGEGATMPVESIATPGSGHLKLTGSLGEVGPKTHSC